MEHVEEGLGELVVASGDGSVDLQIADHALDAVASAVNASVPTNWGLAVGARRYGGADAALTQGAADGVGIVAFVGQQVGGFRLGESGYGLERRTVCRFAGGEVEDERGPSGITETMNFTAEPAPRAAKSLFASPPFAPAAETWPRTVVLSMLWRELSAIAWARVVATTSQTPLRLQRRKRWYTVIHLPYFSATARRCGYARECRSRLAGCRAPGGSCVPAPPAANPSADAIPLRLDRLDSRTPPLQEESLNQASSHTSIIL